MHPQTTVDPAVIGVCDRCGIILPFVLSFRNVSSYRDQNGAVIPCDLYISLRVIGRGKYLLNSKFHTDVQEELRGELRSIIGHHG
jgi:hypothetical protein